jgi:hypothetical protein
MTKSVLKLSLIALVFLQLLSSCKKYQYVSVVGDSYRADINENIIETDSVLISYRYNGKGCPLKVNVVNRLNQPLYVDWSKSSVIINGQRFSLWMDASSIKTNTESVEYQWSKDISTTSSSTNGVIVKNERVSFIPPHSGVVYQTPFALFKIWIELPDTTTFKRVPIATEVESMNAKLYSFTRDNSPLVFRSFLTISTNEQFTNPRFFDNTFWITNIIETQASPDNLLNTFPNQFYNSKATGFGAFMGGVALAGGIVVILLTAGQ